MTNEQLFGTIAIAAALLLATAKFQGMAVPRKQVMWMAMVWFGIAAVIGLVLWMLKAAGVS